MPQTPPLPQSRWSALLPGMAALAVVASIIIVPDQAFQSSLTGLQIWWKFVFPALLPLLILSELLTGLGAVHALGVLFGPLMRPLFRVPGAGGWAAAVGLAAGFPAGAEVTARLAARGLLSRTEAERLLAVAHVASPMLPVAFIGAGLLRDAGLGLGLAAAHYAAALGAGALLRFWGGAEPAPALERERARQPAPARRRGLFARAAAAMREANAADGRVFGKLLGDAVGDAVQKLTVVGGYIIFFSVMARMISLAAAAVPSLHALEAVLTGLLEPHLGVYAAVQGSPQLSAAGAAWIGALLGWSGLSLHAQVKSFTHGTGIRYFPFFLARILHGGLAAGLTLLFWDPISRLSDSVRPVSAQVYSIGSAPYLTSPPIALWLACSILILAVFAVVLVMLSAMANALRR